MTKKRPHLFNKEYQKEWSEEYKYKHIHTGEYCNFESYLAEYLILRWIDAFNKEKPSYKFWTVGDKYHDMFMRNMKAARGLKKKFEEKTILEAIESDYFKNVYHIGLKAYGPRGWKYNQVALQAIKSYHSEQKDLKKAAKQAKISQEIEVKEEKPLVRRTKSSPSNKQSMINKLRNL